jgi:hypothetical protein
MGVVRGLAGQGVLQAISHRGSQSAADRPLLILEIGAGFNTPGVVRWPLERLAVRHPLARFVRINREYPAIPPELGDRGIGMGGDAGDTLQTLWRSET